MAAPLETVNAFISALVEKRFDDALTLVTDDCEYDNVPMGKNHGPAAVREFLGGLTGDLEVEFITHRETATGNMVMNERTDRFTNGDKQHDLPVMGVFEINDDGKISLWRDYFDMGPVNAMFADLAG